MSYDIRRMNIEDYDFVIALWKASEGIGLSADDTREGIALYLEKNPGYSFTAWVDGQLVGAVLCGHDSRRGYLHHLAVSKDYRHRGIGKVLTERCMQALKEAGITKCHIFVFRDNYNAIAFWKKIGWVERVELTLLSKPLSA